MYVRQLECPSVLSAATALETYAVLKGRQGRHGLWDPTFLPMLRAYVQPPKATQHVDAFEALTHLQRCNDMTLNVYCGLKEGWGRLYDYFTRCAGLA
jgi:hypothetical protein